MSESSNVIRFTREKLLALRPRPDPNLIGPPPNLKHLEDNPILSQQPLDPVCWDTFDADEIWAVAARERSTRTSGVLAIKTNGPNLKGLEEPSDNSAAGLLRRSSGPLGGGGGKWQRGVALPPPDENSHRRGSRPDSDNPNDLWDDPLAATDAALDFSAFGEIPDDPKNVGEAFDFDKMTEATQAFEEELRGDRSDTDADTEGDENGDPRLHTVVVNPHRPLATVGTTIRSGSGDNVNVFEDFDDSPAPAAAVKAADEDPSASSRLMKMIGVNQEETSAPNPASLEEPAKAGASLNPWAAGENASKQADDSAGTGSANIPSNPWGDSILVPNAQSQQQIDGFDLAARLQLEQQAREELLRRQSLQDAEMRRRQEDEARRQAMEVRARQQAAQQGVVHSEIELVLIERISIVLENSWGRSDLMSILTALRTEDSRIAALLGNVEALRALIARHPRRIAVRQDPAFGAEMAVLLMTNAQFQQQQQQEAQARAQQEQMQRREQQLRMQASQSAQNGSRSGLPQIVANAPWFYSDPQKNIQGPFRGEEMRQWLEAGYFKGDLPISQQPGGPFHPLSTLFQDVSSAFRVPGQSVDAEAEQAATREAVLHQRAMEEAERREADHREAIRREAEERAAAELAEARKAAEAQKAAAARAQEQNNSSVQLKMMLGLGVGWQEGETQEPQMTLLPVAKAQKQRSQAVPVPVASSSPLPAPKPAWGSAQGQMPKKSMSEIQQEEARQVALQAMERKAAGRSSSGGWANVAASRGGSAGWQGGAALAPPVPAVPAPNSAHSLRPHGGNKPSPAPRQVSAPSAMQQQQCRSSQEDQHADDFGASMSPALESWCKAQMTKINGSDDLTLVSFCMTLTDPSEIRQYLTAYLGSSTQVNNFASEFINKRGLGKTLQEEWEDMKPKKTRKKGGK